MELPLAPTSRKPTPAALVRALRHAELMIARAAAIETELAGAVTFHRVDRPNVNVANFAAEARVPEGVDAPAVVREILDHYASISTTCHWILPAENSLASPVNQQLAAALNPHGFRPLQPTSLYLLEHFAPPTRTCSELQIIPGRAAYAQFREFVKSSASQQWNCDDKTAADIAAHHLDALDDARIEPFLGRFHGKPAGMITVIPVGQIGVIDAVYVAPEFRGRGVSSSLLAHALDFCDRAMFEQVILEAEPGSIAAQAYERRGFKLVSPLLKFMLGTPHA